MKVIHMENGKLLPTLEDFANLHKLNLVIDYTSKGYSIYFDTADCVTSAGLRATSISPSLASALDGFVDLIVSNRLMDFGGNYISVPELSKSGLNHIAEQYKCSVI